MEVKFLTDDADYEAVLDVLLKLCVDCNRDTLSVQIKQQQSSGYWVTLQNRGECYEKNNHTFSIDSYRLCYYYCAATGNLLS